MNPDCQFHRQTRQNANGQYYPIIQISVRTALLCALCILCIADASPSSSQSSPSAGADKQLERLGLPGVRPDPFVAASPLIVAAVCSDGVAMIAAHTASSKEKLLRDYRNDYSKDCENEANNDDKPDNQATAVASSSVFQDLPQDHGGPYRIQTIDRCGTHLLSAGWRADCDLLTAKVRSLSSRETSLFGPPKWGLHFSRQLAQETSLWMAQCAVSDAMRPLSCVGLLVGCADQNTDSTIDDYLAGSLWFVDVTGAHRVRALAVGGGKAEEDGTDKGNRVVAQRVNLQLQQTDFASLTVEEGVECLLKILKGHNATNAHSTDGDVGDSGDNMLPLLSDHCELEIGVTGREGAMRRLKLAASGAA